MCLAIWQSNAGNCSRTAATAMDSLSSRSLFGRSGVELSVARSMALPNGAVVPIQNAERAQGDPAIRRAYAASNVLVKSVLVSHVEQPPPVRLPTLAHDRESLVDSRVRLGARCAEIVQRAQHVVVPKGRKRELHPT